MNISNLDYSRLDSEIVGLVKAMNNTGVISTIGSCIGHGTDPVATVIFKIESDLEWPGLRYAILNMSQHLDYANIDIYQWYRIDSSNGVDFSDWLLEIEIHPRNKEATLPEGIRLLSLKQQAIASLIRTLTEYQPGD